MITAAGTNVLLDTSEDVAAVHSVASQVVVSAVAGVGSGGVSQLFRGEV